MKVLIADEDRDFLSSFRKLCELDNNEAVTVFDGTQAVGAVTKQKFDIVIINRELPRISSRDIIGMLNERNIPVIEISGKRPDSDILLDSVLANAYLKLPFFPYELFDLASEVLKKTGSGEKIIYEDIEINASDFMLCGKQRVTNGEIDIIKTLIAKEKPCEKYAEPYINALNNKFEKLQKKLRIRYLMNEGYRLVSDYE